MPNQEIMKTYIVPSGFAELSRLLGNAVEENSKNTERKNYFVAEDRGIKGYLGQLMCMYILLKEGKLKLNMPLETNNGKTYFDIVIDALRFEIKTNVAIKFDELPNVEGYDFIVNKSQRDAGRGRGVLGYISIALNKDYTKAKFMGYIASKYIDMDKNGEKRQVRCDIQDPAYIIPFLQLNQI